MKQVEAARLPQRRWLERARQVLPGGLLGMTSSSAESSMVASHGVGSKLYDLEGREYLDCRLAGGPLILGHCHPAVVAAVKEQLTRGFSFYALSQPVIDLAELIVSAVPCAEQIRFCASGSDANFFALRIARTYTGRRKLLKFEGGYHGVHDSLLMSFTPSKPLPFPQPRA